MMELLKSPIFVSKLTELVLAIICACLIEGLDTAESTWQKEITHAAIYGYILLNILIIVSFVYTEPISVRLRVMTSGVGTVLFLLSAIIMISYYASEYYVPRRILASGLISLINGVLFGGDTFFTTRYLLE